MTIDIPDNCTCTDSETCSRCVWECACALVELETSYEREAAMTFEEVYKRRQRIITN